MCTLCLAASHLVVIDYFPEITHLMFYPLLCILQTAQGGDMPNVHILMDVL